jgi:hypothetical protein
LESNNVMIKLSDLKAGLSNPNTLTSLYLSNNIFDTIVGRDLIIDGYSSFRVRSDGGFSLQNGSEGTIGDVLTSVDAYGTGQWVTNPNNLQAAYEALNTVTTSNTYGDLTVAGTESFVVSATGGILATKITTNGADLVVGGSNNLSIETSLRYKDGSEGTVGDVLTSVGLNGETAWVTPVTTLQQAYNNNNTIITNSGADLIISGSEMVVLNNTKGLLVSGDLDLDGYASIGNYLIVGGSFELSSNAIIAGDTKIDGYLVVDGYLNVGGQLTVADDAYFTGSYLSIQSSVKIVDGTQQDGYVLTSDAYGNSSWQEPVSDLQGAYETSNTITTSAFEGDLTISGTEKVIINTSGGLDLSANLDVTGDAYFTGLVSITGEIVIQDGTQGTAGHFWKSTDTTGSGSWSALPAATGSSEGTVSRELTISETPIPGTIVWHEGNAPSAALITAFRCIRVGNRVDVWFHGLYTTPNASPSTGVTFPLPPACPTPGLWGVHVSGEILAYGEGRVFESAQGNTTTDQDHTSRVTLYESGGTYAVTIVTFKRVQNAYGAFAQVPLNPIGFNAHITYFV